MKQIAVIFDQVSFDHMKWSTDNYMPMADVLVEVGTKR